MGRSREQCSQRGGKMPKVGVVCRTGVYVIRNLTNGKVYVGGAYKDFDHRFSIHKRDLRANRHGNEHLQSAWNKYGEGAFEFVVLERCAVSSCEDRETYWIDKLNAVDRRFGYNKSPTGGSPLGTKHSPRSRKNFSAAMKKRMEDPEERLKAGKGMRGKTHTEEFKTAQSERSKRMWAECPELRARIVAANTGKKRTAEQRERISASLRGKPLSKEHKAKCRVANLGRKRSTEASRKAAEKNRGRKRTPEQCERIAAAQRGKKRSQQAILNAATALRASRAAETAEERKKYGKANVGINRRKEVIHVTTEEPENV